MAALILLYPGSPELRQENGWNAALVDAADAAAARTAAIDAKPDGSTSDSKIALWSATIVAATAGTLPGGVTCLWLDGVKGIGAARAV